jgi:hypothetical protein
MTMAMITFGCVPWRREAEQRRREHRRLDDAGWADRQMRRRVAPSRESGGRSAGPRIAPDRPHAHPIRGEDTGSSAHIV